MPSTDTTPHPHPRQQQQQRQQKRLALPRHTLREPHAKSITLERANKEGEAVKGARNGEVGGGSEARGGGTGM
eukprot:364798-Chlamydomonas_euryale.AAC.24